MVLGIDTSNYSTSAALYDAATGQWRGVKRLLPVKAGERGLRQSDALFLHNRQLPEVLDELFSLDTPQVSAVGVSTAPRDVEGSYMPCFLAGKLAATAAACALGAPLYFCSHQQGHVAAALFGCGALHLLKTGCYVFHVSGGTTELLWCLDDGQGGIKITRLAGTMDLNAGQLIDRVGVRLGLPFPAGPQLEKLAEAYREPVRARAVLKGLNPCLSGFENKAEQMLSSGQSAEKTAKFVLCAVLETVSAMTAEVFKQHGRYPVVYAGGVMSNRFLKNELQNRFDGLFCEPQLSADNAVGVAVLAARKEGSCGR